MSDRQRRSLYGILWLLAFLLLLAIMSVIAYFMTGFVYHQLAWQPPALLVQAVNSMLGLLLVVGVIAFSTRFFRPKRLAEQMKIIAPLLDAFQRIARGDFDVQIAHDYGGHEEQLFGELVTGVNSMAQQLKQMEEMRQEFISNVSHEIQSPLTSIRGFAQALQNNQLTPDERGHYLSIIETESTRLSKLSDNLLSLAALDAKTVQLDCKPFRLDRQLRNLILACEPQWSAKELELVVNAEECTFTGDENLLSQVWVNLLHNAIKFTPEQGMIEVCLHNRADAVEVAVKDTGIGIAPTDQERLFERFFKADKARNRALGGNGLGLAIAKQVVDLHGGKIRVESMPGQGTTITVHLPTKVFPA